MKPCANAALSKHTPSANAPADGAQQKHDFQWSDRAADGANEQHGPFCVGPQLLRYFGRMVAAFSWGDSAATVCGALCVGASVCARCGG